MCPLAGSGGAAAAGVRRASQCGALFLHRDGPSVSLHCHRAVLSHAAEGKQNQPILLVIKQTMLVPCISSNRSILGKGGGLKYVGYFLLLLLLFFNPSHCIRAENINWMHHLKGGLVHILSTLTFSLKPFGRELFLSSGL